MSFHLNNAQQMALNDPPFIKKEQFSVLYSGNPASSDFSS